MNLKSLSEGVVLSLWACEQQLELSLLSIFFLPDEGASALTKADTCDRLGCEGASSEFCFRSLFKLV